MPVKTRINRPPRFDPRVDKSYLQKLAKYYPFDLSGDKTADFYLMTDKALEDWFEFVVKRITDHPPGIVDIPNEAFFQDKDGMSVPVIHGWVNSDPVNRYAGDVHDYLYTHMGRYDPFVYDNGKTKEDADRYLARVLYEHGHKTLSYAVEKAMKIPYISYTHHRDFTDAQSKAGAHRALNKELAKSSKETQNQWLERIHDYTLSLRDKSRQRDVAKQLFMNQLKIGNKYADLPGLHDTMDYRLLYRNIHVFANLAGYKIYPEIGKILDDNLFQLNDPLPSISSTSATESSVAAANYEAAHPIPQEIDEDLFLFDVDGNLMNNTVGVFTPQGLHEMAEHFAVPDVVEEPDKDNTRFLPGMRGNLDFLQQKRHMYGALRTIDNMRPDMRRPVLYTILQSNPIMLGQVEAKQMIHEGSDENAVKKIIVSNTF